MSLGAELDDLGIDLDIDTTNMTPEERAAAEAAALRKLEEKFAAEEAALMEELMMEEEAMAMEMENAGGSDSSSGSSKPISLSKEERELWAEVQAEQHAQAIKKVIEASKKKNETKRLRFGIRSLFSSLYYNFSLYSN
jgi:hypothetical protein